jgi:hypothetical protein
MKLYVPSTIEQITDRLKALPEVSGRSNWTSHVKVTFIELAAQQGYKVCASVPEEVRENVKVKYPHCLEWGEWLYDLVWYSEQDSGMQEPFTTSVPLVMECEWDIGIPALALDFNKLLVANADLRVMVCGCYEDGQAAVIRKYCERAVQAYEQGRPGDNFLLCILCEHGQPEFYPITK